MPTSDPGSKASPQPACLARPARGFTLLELLVVLAIVAMISTVVMLSLRDGLTSQLEREGERLGALLESARAEARASGAAVAWVPGAAPDEPAFRFVGVAAGRPNRWLDDRVTAQVLGRPALVLGPDAILPAQRVVLRLADRRLDLATDGLGPFTAVAPPPVQAQP